jgi:pyruvate,orthophosphate dikinase
VSPLKLQDPSIYRFGNGEADGDGSMTEKLGGKGAGLAEMTRMGVPVPAGFTISTDVCRSYLRDGKVPATLDRETDDSIAWLELQHGQRFGGTADPLLVSVRSGAAVSMPGMMDTILNVGLHDGNVEAFAAQHGNPRFAFDSYRRLLQMFGSVVLHVPKSEFDAVLNRVKHSRNVVADAELDAAAFQEVIAGYKAVIVHCTGREFPMDPREQVRMAVEAVFDSWMNERAVYYRKINNISDNSGTAVTVQAMVFGNYGSDSGTGVGFTRNPSTGEAKLFGEFLADAQGEDIVAGTRTPQAIAELARTMPAVFAQLKSVTSKLEADYRDMQDFEFTVQRGKLFLLQTRSAKRSALAAIRVAVEMAQEGLISKTEAIKRVKAQAIDEALSPQLDLSGTKVGPIAKGLAASPGSAVGQIGLTADRAVEMAGKQRENPIILVRQETTADDIHGMHASVGFLTAHGGATSHAAVVARGMGKCCITGAHGIVTDDKAGTVKMGDEILREGDWLSLDGSTGRVFNGKLPLKQQDLDNEWVAMLLHWASQVESKPVRANADTPDDAQRARDAGATGIGLCRTEHMFFAPGRLPFVRAMILARSTEERQAALDSLLPSQQNDFEEIFRSMAGLPVTIRLIDPPLHEFLPTEMIVTADLAAARSAGDAAKVAEAESLLTRVRELHESNPMMGHRGCRLGITYPEIITMQVTAILRAAIKVRAEGVLALPEIMVPLVASVEEIRYLRTVIEEAASAVFAATGETFHYLLGTMIELPRAAVCAGSIAAEVDFLSFGTNDLTQMTFGFSRDDARKFLDRYVELGILKNDPFVTIDREGVGALVKGAIQQARATKPNIKIGVCGEHGGDPASIEFFHTAGVDYVSCSPARIAVARLSTAQAAITHSKPAKVSAITARSERHSTIRRMQPQPMSARG